MYVDLVLKPCQCKTPDWEKDGLAPGTTWECDVCGQLWEVVSYTRVREITHKPTPPGAAWVNIKPLKLESAEYDSPPNGLWVSLRGSFQEYYPIYVVLSIFVIALGFVSLTRLFV